jgi:hypothetical protein
LLTTINNFIQDHIRTIELLGVFMRIFSFAFVSIQGPESPFLFIWVFNTVDAIILSWCSILKKDTAYIVLNVFWVLIGILGIYNAGGLSH